MLTRILAVAVLAAVALAAEAGFFHAAVGAPLASALGELRAPVRATFEESITVVASKRACEPKALHCS